MSGRARILGAGAALLLVAGCSGGGGDGGPSCRHGSPSATGPGDVSSHFPLSVGARWHFDVTESTAGLPGSAARSRWRMEVTGTRAVGGTTASVFAATPVDGPGTAEEAMFAKGPSGVTMLGVEPVEPPLDRIYPYQVIAFPLVAGARFEQYSCSGLDLGVDLDGDTRSERLDVTSTVTVAGEEDVLVPAGEFRAMRVDTTTTLTIRATSGQTATESAVESVWYAPGVGRVRSSSAFGTGSDAELSEAVLVGYEVEGIRRGFQARAILAEDLSPGISDTETPGRPALAFDGTGHLLVARSNPSGVWNDHSLRAQVLGADGATIRQLAVTDRTGYGQRPAAAFSGTNHLVVSNLCSDDCSTIFAQRVTPAGDPLDGADGFDLTTGGQTVYAPAVASDGDGWLVAWTRFQGGLEAARVSAEGAVLGTLSLRAAVPQDSGAPAMAFGGGVYLVAWVEGTEVLALRVQPDGTVLDDPPIAVSSSAGGKSMGGVAFDGTRFLVAWGDSRRGEAGVNGPVHDVYAARIGTDGTLLDGPPATGGIVVNAFPGTSKLYSVVAPGGPGFVIAWWIDGFYGDVGVFAARVDGDGVLLDGPASGTGLRVAGPTVFASRFVHPVAVPAAGDETLVAWVDNTEMSGSTKSILGAWYAW
jgi:hypothetical protein